MESVFNKVTRLNACIFIEGVFLGILQEILKNNFFMEHLFNILLQNFM